MCHRADSHPRRPVAAEEGFTLLEMVIGLTLFAIVGGSLYTVLIRTGEGDRLGTSVTEAQQNARGAINMVLRDLRQLGYGLDPDDPPPIVAASEFRLTLGSDLNEDGDLDPGERVTYFFDPVGDDPLISDTPNPNDRLLRRILSTAADPQATPAPGKGEVVAFGVTQHAAQATATPGAVSNAYRNVRLFDFHDTDGRSLIGASDDPAGAQYGKTLPDSVLTGTTPGGRVKAIRVDVVTEGTFRSPVTQTYPAVRITGTINPRNLNRGQRAALFTALAPSSGGTGGGTGGGGGGTDTTGGGGEDPPLQLPDMEPPIHIPSKSVVSLTVVDLNERDSQEGSQVLTDGKHDYDILVGTDAHSINNLLVWFEGYPDKYTGGRLYNSYPSYYGNTAHQLNALVAGNVDASDAGRPDLVSAVSTTDTQGGFEVWLNHPLVREGWVGIGSSCTMPDAYYSNASGKGQAVALGDFDQDGDQDLALGTRTGSNAGKIEIWRNDGSGSFSFVRSMNAAGEVNALVPADFDGDGKMDLAAGTKTHTNDKTGSIAIWLNKGGSDFERKSLYSAGGKVNDLAAGSMDDDGTMDLVAGTKTGMRSGGVELWLNNGEGILRLADQVTADDVVLSLAVGQIDYGNDYLDIVAGTAASSVQAWFCDPQAANESNIIPVGESWSDANAGGAVRDVAIAKVEASRDDPSHDLLNDVIVGTAVTTSQGEVVIYLNPYVWTLTQ